MTTTVRITAHCGADTEVYVEGLQDRARGLRIGDDFHILQDGESVEVYAYGAREIRVGERGKLPGDGPKGGELPAA